MPADIRIKRAYDPPSDDDGNRVLIDRYWPRGVKKDAAVLHAWMRELAPSPELIKWFGHQDDRWDAFRERYWDELSGQERQASVDALRDLAANETLTLVYGARDREHNNARALAEYLQQKGE